ncbi:MAG TPA: copper amine oxidase N-terminal domain-containing protein [Syntrophomonadaceae bacterium]|nr:copper amine oxidase N-terminal domain-containing protein [Syntrophomonadaceae bacterium]
MNRITKSALLALVLTGLLVFAPSAFALAPNVAVNGQRLSMEVPPVIEDGRILVPLRSIFEALSASVDWDGSTQTVSITKGCDELKLTIGSSTAYKNGELLGLDVPARVLGDRTLVPLGFVSQALGAAVEWDEANQTAIITLMDSTSSST